MHILLNVVKGLISLVAAIAVIGIVVGIAILIPIIGIAVSAISAVVLMAAAIFASFKGPDQKGK
jgi:hypothetical protein